MLRLLRRRQRCGILVHGLPNCGRHFILACIWDTDVEYGIAIALCNFHRSIHGFEDVVFQERSLPYNSDGGTVTVEKITMLAQLSKLCFSHGHQAIDLIFGPLEIFNTEGIDGDDFDTGLVADF